MRNIPLERADETTCASTAMTATFDRSAQDPDHRVQSEFQREVLAGLAAEPKRIPSKFFYDERGSELFEAICELPEYYLTRTERTILEAHAEAIAELIGDDAVVLEPGSGSSSKTRVLLDAMPNIRAYVPIDISPEPLEAAAGEIRQEYEYLTVIPVVGDYSRSLDLPKLPSETRVIFFPGSTLGNFDKAEATQFLNKMLRIAGPKGAVILGVDLKKDRGMLEAAYNDAGGVTAAFNLNLIDRMRKEFGVDIPEDAFEHYAFYNEAAGRIEMHLVATTSFTLLLSGQGFSFAAGEHVITEYSHKYSIEEIEQLGSAIGMRLRNYWTDENKYFGVFFFEIE